MQDHVLRPRQAFDFGDEVTIGGRDAVSSSSAFVSDRLGSLSYHKSDHPTLNAAAALGPTSTPPTAVLLRGHRACRRGDLSADLATSPYYRTDGHKSRYGRRGVTRGRSSGKTGPPGNGFTPVRGGAIKYNSNSLIKHMVPDMPLSVRPPALGSCHALSSTSALGHLPDSLPRPAVSHI